MFWRIWRCLDRFWAPLVGFGQFAGWTLFIFIKTPLSIITDQVPADCLILIQVECAHLNIAFLWSEYSFTKSIELQLPSFPQASRRALVGGRAVSFEDLTYFTAFWCFCKLRMFLYFRKAEVWLWIFAFEMRCGLPQLEVTLPDRLFGKRGFLHKLVPLAHHLPEQHFVLRFFLLL